MYSVKISNGLANNASKSLSTGSNIPLGFKTNKETKEFELDEVYAPIVKEIFERYAKGETVTEITTDLNNRGYKSSKGNDFNKNSLHRMLNNKKYIGVYTYKGQEMPNPIPRIISDELFNEVQEIMEKNKKSPARQKAFTEYLLTQKLFCGYCKEMMTGYSAKKKYNYYGCKGKKQHKCNKQPIHKNFIEDLVFNETKEFLNNQKNIDMIIKEIEALAKDERNEINLKDLKKQLKAEQTKKENLLNALANCSDEDIRKDIYAKMNKIKTTINYLENEIVKIETPIDTMLLDKIQFVIEEMRNGNIQDIKFKKLLINMFISEIYLYDDMVTIVFLTSKKENIKFSQDISSKQTESLFNLSMVE